MLHEPQIMAYEFELVLQIFLRTFMIFDFLKKRSAYTSQIIMIIVSNQIEKNTISKYMH